MKANHNISPIAQSGQNSTLAQIAFNLDLMIRHQRIAELSEDYNQQQEHFREALRFRAEAGRLEGQIRIARRFMFISFN